MMVIRKCPENHKGETVEDKNSGYRTRTHQLDRGALARAAASIEHDYLDKRRGRLLSGGADSERATSIERANILPAPVNQLRLAGRRSERVHRG